MDHRNTEQNKRNIVLFLKFMKIFLFHSVCLYVDCFYFDYQRARELRNCLWNVHSRSYHWLCFEKLFYPLHKSLAYLNKFWLQNYTFPWYHETLAEERTLQIKQCRWKEESRKCKRNILNLNGWITKKYFVLHFVETEWCASAEKVFKISRRRHKMALRKKANIFNFYVK